MEIDFRDGVDTTKRQQAQWEQFLDRLEEYVEPASMRSFLRSAYKAIFYKTISLFGDFDITYSLENKIVIGMTVFFSPTKRIYVACTPQDKKVTVNYLDSAISPMNFYSKEVTFVNDEADIEYTQDIVIPILENAWQYFYRNQCQHEDIVKPFDY